MNSSSTDPGQGYDQSHIRVDGVSPLLPSLDLDSSATASKTTTTISSSSAITTPSLSRPISYPPATERRDGHHPLGPGSPPKRRSPLRQSISYTDYADYRESLASPTPRSGFAKGHSRSRSEIPDMAFMNNKDAGKLLEAPSQDHRTTWYMRRNSAFDQVEHRRPSTANETSPSDKSKNPSSAGSSPFSFFTRMSAKKELASSPAVEPLSDELLNLDIEAALFPHGSPSNGDALSPGAVLNLQTTATDLLKKFQAAYQSQAITIQDLKAEREAQDDEKAEAETRTRHLKMQLEDMARKASETEAVMQALIEELNKEKRQRMEERLAREKATSQFEGSISEDLGVEEDQQRRVWRRSGETSKSDFSFETDEDSIEEASLFSRPRSPTLTVPSISEASFIEGPMLTPPARSSTYGQPRPTRQSQPQMTTFQKIFKGISGDPAKDEGLRGFNGCRNCQGQEANMAWDTVSLLRVENKGLKQRVGELEIAVEEALDVVNGIGL